MKQLDNTTHVKASDYDKQIRDTIPFYDCFLEEAIDLVRTLKPSAEVWLDTGCGTGTLVIKAFPYFPNTQFILADPSDNMLHQAKLSLNAIPVSHLQFLNPIGTENLLTSDIQMRQPQIITAIQSHHYMDENTRRTATQACYELLAEDGVYITFENVHPKSEKGTTIALDRWARYQQSKGKSQEMINEHRKRFNTAYFPITIEQHLQLLKACGFATCDLFWYSYMQAGFYAVKE